MKTLNDALAELLIALGFDAMAADAKVTTDQSRMRKYASIILKQTKDAHAKTQLRNIFAASRLI